jgi:hypothetical protein
MSLSYRAYVHPQRSSRQDRAEANHLVASLLVATASVHLVKRFVNRLQPDQTIVHGSRPRAHCCWLHYPTNVAGGLLLGRLVERLMRHWHRFDMNEPRNRVLD